MVSWLFNLKDVIPAEGYAKHTKNTDKCELGEMAVCPKVKVKQVYSVPIISMNPQLPGGGGISAILTILHHQCFVVDPKPVYESSDGNSVQELSS